MTRSLLKHGARSEIIKSFEKLEKDGLIKKLDFKSARGRRQYNYKITENGLSALICHDPHPLKFWKALFGYCHHDDKGLTADKIDEYYKLFIDRFLKYKQPGFFSTLFFFDVLHEWFRKTLLKSYKLGAEQKVVEVLARYPGISFEELVKKAAVGEYEVKKCLVHYTLECPPDRNEIKYHGKRSLAVIENELDKYLRFILHNIIVLKKDSMTNVESYELSLFGVMLAISIIRHKERKALKHILHYQHLSFANYYNIIASNYKNKLPLIFGKWTLLNDILKSYSAYNFDFILERRRRLADSCSKRSLIRGGIKELVESFREMADQNHYQFEKLSYDGERVKGGYYSSYSYSKGRHDSIPKDYLMENYIAIQSQVNQNKTVVLEKKIHEVTSFSRLPVNILYQDADFIKKMSIQFEQQFANEIASLYYIHLYSELFDLEKPTEQLLCTLPKSPYSPKGCLSLLINRDTDKPFLSEWFYNLMDEINNHQKEIQAALPKRQSSY
jgi:hypothetical protein